MKNLLVQYTAYNIWANTQFGILLSDLDPALYDKEIISSFPSLRKTVHHIWDAELIWLSRMKNQVIVWPPSAQFANPAIDEFVNCSKAFDEFVRFQDDDFLKSTTTYKNTKGKEFTNLNSGIIMHCMNHSTSHRGQLVTMLRTIGITQIPATDLIGFLRDGM
jgi:uncharacterized damage-inducible protein DinB